MKKLMCICALLGACFFAGEAAADVLRCQSIQSVGATKPSMPSCTAWSEARPGVEYDCSSVIPTGAMLNCMLGGTQGLPTTLFLDVWDPTRNYRGQCSGMILPAGVPLTPELCGRAVMYYQACLADPGGCH